MMASTSSSMPSSRTATRRWIGGHQPPSASEPTAWPISSIPRISDSSLPAPPWSALLITKTSATSRIPALAAWIESPMPGRQGHDRGVRGGRHLDLGLAHADGLDDHVVEAGGVEDQCGLGRGEGQPAEVPARGHRADVDALVLVVALHADAVAEQRPAGERRGRVDGQHAHGAATAAQLGRQGVGQGGLADARRARDADHPGMTGVREDPGDDAPQHLRCPVLDAGQRPGQGPALAGEHALDQLLHAVVGHGAGPRVWRDPQARRGRPPPGNPDPPVGHRPGARG